MGTFFAKLRQWWDSLTGPQLSEAQVQQLRRTFSAFHDHFQRLLASNHQALVTMAEMEATLGGSGLYGMAFVKGRCRSVADSVLEMIRSLGGMAPRRYEELLARHRDICGHIESLWDHGRRKVNRNLTVSLTRVDLEWMDRVGGKMANLGEMTNRLGLPVPPGFAITVGAYDLFFDRNALPGKIAGLLEGLDFQDTEALFAKSAQVRKLIREAPLPPELAWDLEEACRKLMEEVGEDIRLALRSSAVGEDTADMSFAGQYTTLLNVRPSNLLDAYTQVVGSKYSPQALLYRYTRGLRDQDMPMGAGCQAMVPARAGGVIYTADPLDIQDDSLRISSTWGLPKGVVDGGGSVDGFVVSRGRGGLHLGSRSIARKETRFECLEEGVRRLANTGGMSGEPSLSDELVLQLAAAAVRVEEHFAAPQDVEFALDPKGGLVFLQCRPLQLAQAAKPRRPLEVSGAEVVASGGIRVSKGVASGPVHWVRNQADAAVFPPGAVLALDHPSPQWAALLGGASAVTARGGNLAGHLATVAREYGVPALFALGDQVAALKQGMDVTVDADGRAVYLGVIRQLLSRARDRKNLMQGSPVQKTLQTALEQIAPLTLFDPDSTDFLPSNCRTLHDITRYCHEIAVRELFYFGRNHRFSELAAKQLFHEVPMQYWIIDLEDGFKPGVEGRYVKLEQIACSALLALWEGIIAVPWEGPPAMTGKGFASVMFEATVNPALSTPFHKPMANKNYFMVSRHFMNLQSRFGYHLTTVETMVDQPGQSGYITFAFSGGAAGPRRRNARAYFVGEIMARLGYKVKVKEDTLRARLRGGGNARMLNQLKALGYLLMHTRQLDMIMAHPPSVDHYRRRITQDLESLGAL